MSPLFRISDRWGVGWIRESFEIRPGYKVAKQELRYVKPIHASQPGD
jgi:hypothetical protein